MHPADDGADDIPDASQNFTDYINSIETEGFRVWDTQNRPDASTRLLLRSQNDGRRIVLSGRPDFVICERDSTLADFLYKTCCIIEIQSKPDEEACELQLMSYLYIFMNKLGLKKVVGFLVYNDGQVRAYRASRNPNVVFEQNERFNIQHIVGILHQLMGM